MGIAGAGCHAGGWGNRPAGAGAAAVRDGRTGDGSTPFTQHPWAWRGLSGLTLRTEHYLIHTTLRESDTRARVATVMEAALARYRGLAPGLPAPPHRLECFIFADRSEWALYTAATTGADAGLYLQINRGGYTIGTRFVCYDLGSVGLYAACAHEGFHQYSAAVFAHRPPPFLEEGIASLFENISQDDVPVFNLSANPARQHRLAAASSAGGDQGHGAEAANGAGRAYGSIDSHDPGNVTGPLMPLADLSRLQAGDALRRPAGQVDLFYAQCWALAAMLRESPEFSADFAAMLRNQARPHVPQRPPAPPGTAAPPGGAGAAEADFAETAAPDDAGDDPAAPARNPAQNPAQNPAWNPADGAKFLTQTFHTDLNTLQTAYTRFVRRLTRSAD